MAIIKKGEKAQSFTLKDQTKKDVSLSDFKGKKILLSFHPFAWTGVCAKQMQSLEKNNTKFKKLNTVALGINVDPIPSKAAWAKELKIKKQVSFRTSGPMVQWQKNSEFLMKKEDLPKERIS